MKKREVRRMQVNFQITEKMLGLVHNIAELLTKYSIEKRPLLLRKENRIRSIQSSLAIENNSLTLEQVTDIIEGRRVLGPPKDIHEVQNAYEAYERVFSMNPYRVEDFLKAHELLTKELVKHPGQFRLSDVGVYDGSGRVVHIGARPQFVPGLVEELFSWAKNSDLLDLVKSCLVHFELEMIHPFEDGNGRMGRLWQSLILSRWNPLFEWLPIESVIHAHQQGYYDALAISNKENDATVFVEFMLEVILETLEEVKVQDRIEEENTEYIVLPSLKPKEREVFEQVKAYLEQYGNIGNQQAQELTGLSAATVRRYLSLFVKVGLLTSSGSTKGKLYSLSSI